MSAWVDDEPVDYALTDAGWAAARGCTPGTTYTVPEAAELLGMSRTYIGSLALRGAVEAVKVGRVWLVDGDSLRAYIARPRRGGNEQPRIDAAPLLRQIDLRGGPAACGVLQHSAEEKAIERARVEGTITIWAADEIAVKVLGLLPWELWGDLFSA